MSTKCESEKLAPQHKSAFFSFIKVRTPFLATAKRAQLGRELALIVHSR
jgi:hypothetical protein